MLNRLAFHLNLSSGIRLCNSNVNVNIDFGRLPASITACPMICDFDFNPDLGDQQTAKRQGGFGR
jgi:hypothetical protein